MSDVWHVLVVDDEPDVHETTRLALKRMRWQDRPFQITSAMSAEQARKILNTPDKPGFQVALIDVVMEAENSGLQLCQDIRRDHSRALRIVLRTGQPGQAPKAEVLNQYDIDYYVSKAEATAESLYLVVRACLRASQDISTLLAFGHQLHRFTDAMQHVATSYDLLLFLQQGLEFLDLKHGLATTFIADIDEAVPDPALHEASSGPIERNQPEMRDRIVAGLRKAHAQTSADLQLVEGHAFGLKASSMLLPFTSHAADRKTVLGGVYAEPRPDALVDTTREDFCGDVRIFLENWRLAHASLQSQEQATYAKVMRERMNLGHIEGIVKAVRGVAEQIADCVVRVNEVDKDWRTGIKRLEVLGHESNELETLLRPLEQARSRNAQAAASLDSLVKKLVGFSASPATGAARDIDLVDLINDSIDLLRVEMNRANVRVAFEQPTDASIAAWEGYPALLRQVVIRLLDNAIRHAYPEGDGLVTIVLQPAGDAGVAIEVVDRGIGVPASKLPHLFEPVRGGLGVAICHGIVVDTLNGELTCESSDKGTVFRITLPQKVVPRAKTVLIVDDSAVSRMLVKSSILKAYPDWSVIEEGDAGALMEKPLETEPDFVLVDFMMPNINGLDLAAMLRQRHPRARISLLTANTQELVRDKASELGIGFIAKPVTIERIVAFLAQVQ